MVACTKEAKEVIKKDKVDEKSDEWYNENITRIMYWRKEPAIHNWFEKLAEYEGSECYPKNYVS